MKLVNYSARAVVFFPQNTIESIHGEKQEVAATSGHVKTTRFRDAHMDKSACCNCALMAQ